MRSSRLQAPRMARAKALKMALDLVMIAAADNRLTSR